MKSKTERIKDLHKYCENLKADLRGQIKKVDIYYRDKCIQIAREK